MHHPCACIGLPFLSGAPDQQNCTAGDVCEPCRKDWQYVSETFRSALL